MKDLIRAIDAFLNLDWEHSVRIEVPDGVDIAGILNRIQDARDAIDGRQFYSERTAPAGCPQRYMNEGGYMKPHEDGRWIIASDRDAEVERLTAERDALHKQLADVLKISTEVPFDRCILHAGERLAGRAMRIKEVESDRDAAVARAERAESVVSVARNLKFFREHEDRDWTFCIKKEELAELRAALAAAPDKPQYAALEPEPWGGPDGEGQCRR